MKTYIFDWAAISAEERNGHSGLRMGTTTIRRDYPAERSPGHDRLPRHPRADRIQKLLPNATEKEMPTTGKYVHSTSVLIVAICCQ